MKTLKRIISVFLIVIMVLTSIPTTSLLGLELEDLFITKAKAANSYVLCWPVPTSFKKLNYVDTIGPDSDFWGPRNVGSVYHKGVDFTGGNGKDVYAVHKGIVIAAPYKKPNSNGKGGYNSERGNYVVIYHPDLDITSLYEHLNDVLVEDNQEVNIGDKIGIIGNTGAGTGPHLHFGLMYGDPRDDKRKTYSDIANYDHELKYVFDPFGKNSNGVSKVANVTYHEKSWFDSHITKSNSKISAKDIKVPLSVKKGKQFVFSGKVSSSDGLLVAGILICDLSNPQQSKRPLQSSFESPMLYQGPGLPTTFSSISATKMSRNIDLSKLDSGKYRIYIFASTKAYGPKNIEELISSDDYLIIYDNTFEIKAGSNKVRMMSSNTKASASTTYTDSNGNEYFLLNGIFTEKGYSNSTSTNSVSNNNYYNSKAKYSVGNYRVTAKAGLNTRKLPSATSEKVTAIKYDTIIKVSATDGNWGYTNKGWICLDYTKYVSSLSTQSYSYVKYNIGKYIVAAQEGLRVRSNPSTKSSYIDSLKYKTEFNVSKVDGSWGYSEELKGWLCLDYATYVAKPVVPELPTPATPNLVSVTSSEIAVGDLISVDWDAIENASHYKATLIDKATDKVIETRDKITNTSIKFATPYVGTFDVCVVACNEQKTSVPSYINGITAKAPLTVTFKDWNGTVISTQKISYGRDATLPANPTRTGHTFASWDGSHTCIMEDTTITATYSRNSYKVSFYDYDGTLLKTEDVLYQDSATAPSYTAPTGYSFISWDKDYSKITENLDVKAIIQWSSKYPLEISTTSSIYRNGKTYITTAIINNSPNAVSNAKVIVSLKTAEGKELAEVVSGNISIAAGAVKDLTLNVTYDGAATVGNIFVVKADDQNIPLAKHLVVSVNQGTAWSAWSTSAPPSNALKTESKTEYRYRTKSYTTSTDSALSGWTKYNTTSAYSGWSGWSAWQDASVSSSDLREVKTQTVQDTTKYTAWSDWSGWQDAAITSSNLVDVETRQVVVSSNYKTQYNYSRYKNSAGTWCGPTKGTWNGYSCTVFQETGWMNSALTYVRTDQTNQAGTVKVYKKSGDSLHWYNEQTKQVWVSDNYKTQYRKRTRSYGTKTQYSYRTRSLNYTYYYYKWSDWSGWSTDKVTGNNDKEVETRTTYRYISNIPANVEDKTGVSRTISGSVNANYAGSNALLHIYKANGEAQYYGQTLIGNNGSYSYTFKLKNEPTVQSGDYFVSLSIEGTNQAIMLDLIKAPVPEYTVTFKNYDGSILSTQTVKKGENAISPVSPTRTGYDFIGWNNTATNIQSDLIITAQFSKKVFDIVFIDEINSTTETMQYEYGENISAPDIAEMPEAYDFLGWDAINDGITVVEDNMIINAMYERKTFDVVFLDYAGKVLAEYSVEYGDGIAPPVPVEDGIHQFIEWETDIDFGNITESATILPIFDYVNTVATPVANITSGEYSSKQIVTLSCDTSDAQIYYTVDGTDPLEVIDSVSTFSLRATSQNTYNGILYTGPFEIDSTVELVYGAIKDGMNSSSYNENKYVINNAKERQHIVSIHYGIDDYTRSYIIEEGGKVDLFDNIDFGGGYSLLGVYQDEYYTEEWNLDTDVVVSSMDLYLLWEKDIYTVTFVDKDDNIISNQYVEFMGMAEAPIYPEVLGYKFSGWDTDYNCITSDTVVKASYIKEDDITRISLSNDEIILDSSNDTAQLLATITLADNSSNEHIIWLSEDESVATVNEDGVIKAIGNGKTTIVAVSDDSGISDSCEVIVLFECKHNYLSSVTAPTCIEIGYTTYTCSKCGDTYTGKATNSLGHDMSVIIPIFAPACENEGQDMIKCSRCEYSEIYQTEATGHCDNDGDNMCDDCEKELSDSSKCSCNCHKTGFISFIWKILRFFYKLFGMNKVCNCGVAHY